MAKENFIVKCLHIPNRMSVKITLKYIFKEMCNEFESCAFIKILRRVSANGSLIYPTLLATK